MSFQPIIDYTNKDFASLRQAMLELARYRLPEWNDQSPSDLGVLLVDLFAYMGDITLYYQDRIANELFLNTATERRNIIELLRLIGYELKPPIAASADLLLTFTVPAPGELTTTMIPQGAQFASLGNGADPQLFEYLGPDLNIDLESDQVQATVDGKLNYSGLPVRHSQRVATELVGSSTGEPNQKWPLSQGPLIPESLLVEVDEGAGWIEWQRRNSLLYHTGLDSRVYISGPDSRDYTVQFDADNVAWILFGDGVYGMRPPVGINNIRATYRVGGGIEGNVPAASIVEANSNIVYLDAVTNPLPAAGGADAESIEHAVRFGPLAFRAGQRAVTLNDYVSLAHQAGGVAKVRARSQSWNQVELFVAPEGDTCRPVPDELKLRLLAYFEDKRMVTTLINISNAQCRAIDISLEVVAAHHYNPETVRLDVESAVQELLAFSNVDFAQTLYLSKIYEAVEAIAGVHAVTVTRFRRPDTWQQEIQAILDEFGVASVEELPDIIKRSTDINVAADGRIEINDFEIPTLGVLQVNVNEAVP